MYLMCLWIVLIDLVQGNPFTSHLNLKFIQSCSDKAVFQWELEAEGLDKQVNTNCSIQYKISGSDSVFTTQQFQFSDKDVTIKELKRNSTYEAFVNCSNGIKSSLLSFTAGNHCPDNQKSSDGPEVTVKERHIFSSSITDIVLGVVFGLVAVIIVVVTVYYQYRKCVRRRRLQLYLSTPHTDPFESLQDHMEGQS